MRYYVISPEYDEKDVVCDDGTGPVYPTRDVAEVEAPNRRAARVAAVRLFRERGAPYLTWAEHPFAGLRVEPVEAEAHEYGGCGTWGCLGATG